jgi:transglutaminase-like putative cysteine protease
MLLEIEHRLSFDYDAFVRESFIELRMQPKTIPHQTLLGFVIAVGPAAPVSRYRDWNDNTVHHFTITQYHTRISVVARSRVRTHPAAPALAAAVERRAEGGLGPDLHDLTRFAGPVRPSPALRRFHREAAVPARGPLGAEVRALGAHVHRRLAYRKDVTRYDSTTDDVLAGGAGVCQDFAHVMLALLRLRGIPCRYVSGYLHVAPRPGEVPQSHAWIEFHAPGLGWIPFDPTHNREIDERYVCVGHGRHYDDVPPNRGIFRGNAREALTAEVYTRPLAEDAAGAAPEEIEPIDLPVFPEIPERRREPAFTAADAAAIQQQEEQ